MSISLGLDISATTADGARRAFSIINFRAAFSFPFWLADKQIFAFFAMSVEYIRAFSNR